MDFGKLRKAMDNSATGSTGNTFAAAANGIDKKNTTGIPSGNSSSSSGGSSAAAGADVSNANTGEDLSFREAHATAKGGVLTKSGLHLLEELNALRDGALTKSELHLLKELSVHDSKKVLVKRVPQGFTTELKHITNVFEKVDPIANPELLVQIERSWRLQHRYSVDLGIREQTRLLHAAFAKGTIRSYERQPPFSDEDIENCYYKSGNHGGGAISTSSSSSAAAAAAQDNASGMGHAHSVSNANTSSREISPEFRQAQKDKKGRRYVDVSLLHSGFFIFFSTAPSLLREMNSCEMAGYSGVRV